MRNHDTFLPEEDRFTRVIRWIVRPWRKPERIACVCAFAALTPLLMWPLGSIWSSGGGFSWFYGFPVRTVMIHWHPLRGIRTWFELGCILNLVSYFLTVSTVGNVILKLRARWPRTDTAWALAAFVALVYGVLLIFTLGLSETPIRV